MSQTLQTLDALESNALLDQLLNGTGTYKQKRKGFRNYLIGLMMLDAGLRVGETCRLLQMDLFFEAHPVHSLFVGKEIAEKRGERLIPLTKRIQKAIEKVSFHIWRTQEREPGQFAFYEVNHWQPLSTRQVERIIKYAALNAIHRPVHPHVLRHTFASKLMLTTSMRVVQVLLGHKQLSSTQIYTHPNSQHLKDAIDSLDSEETGETSQKT